MTQPRLMLPSFGAMLKKVWGLEANKKAAFRPPLNHFNFTFISLLMAKDWKYRCFDSVESLLE
jgi:hypothetical protein